MSPRSLSLFKPLALHSSMRASTQATCSGSSMLSTVKTKLSSFGDSKITSKRWYLEDIDPQPFFISFHQRSALVFHSFSSAFHLFSWIFGGFPSVSSLLSMPKALHVGLHRGGDHLAVPHLVAQPGQQHGAGVESPDQEVEHLRKSRKNHEK